MDHLQTTEMKLRAALGKAAPIALTTDFDLHPELRPSNPKLRDAAVLVPIQRENDGWSVILTKRSSALKHHPGQIAFPGGKVDKSDGTTLNAALREANEEIGLPLGSVEILGALPQHQTITSFMVTPYVGLITDPFEPRREIGEVAEIFTVPLKHLLDTNSFQIQGRRWNGQDRKYFTVPYGPYYIWGATARMLRMLAHVMEQSDAN
ncbi:coenzyme A pyrophosphatase [Amylibacter kogurei]|uniref:Coenzyme A pyrophosphatase n=1 Tax=Paramylibacter kogurei TaxID=1889778 RepID=A0A2G5KAC8_9RHOB|nr:coenzyme A pyrophosphatase [Amylibacter kogurei]